MNSSARLHMECAHKISLIYVILSLYFPKFMIY